MTTPVIGAVNLIKSLSKYTEPDDIYKRLHISAITGIPDSITLCPLSRYVIELTGTHPRVTVPHTTIYSDSGIRVVEHSPVLVTFLRKFDHGDYPELFPAGYEFYGCQICELADELIYDSTIGAHLPVSPLAATGTEG